MILLYFDVYLNSLFVYISKKFCSLIIEEIFVVTNSWYLSKFDLISGCGNRKFGGFKYV